MHAGQATGSNFYLKAAQQMMHGLLKHTRVDGGFASIRSVANMEKVTTLDDRGQSLVSSEPSSPCLLGGLDSCCPNHLVYIAFPTGS